MDNATEKEVSLTKAPAIIAPKVDYAFKQMMNNQFLKLREETKGRN